MALDAERARARPGVAVKRALIGRPRASDQLTETLLPKLLALPIFASDALSSVAYATEAALVVLLAASATAAHTVIPISIAVAALLGIVVLSYTQMVRAYETSGGAYAVARENLGTLPGLVAAAALLTDYVLTVAVSVSAGVLAITSAVSSLAPTTTELALAAVAAITLVNLRGVRESGLLFALPTYGFVFTLGAMIAVGLGKCAAGACPQATTPHPLPTGAAGAVGVFVVLRAFASGSSALTGVEAIANGVGAFKRPQARNAAQTLVILGAIAITFFLGVSYLTVATHARPSSTDSVLSQVARAVFPSSSSTGFAYFLVQGFTFAILILAANTSFQGFPRLAAMLARDRFFPRQFVNLGDRLVYSNGVVVLAGLAAALIAVFDANVNSLIHLYVVGVFTAFTLSQAGMVRRWLRTRESGWRLSMALNGIGAVATGVVAVIVVETKFVEGAWAVIVAIPLLVAGFYWINRHYRIVARRLRVGAAAVKAAPPPTNQVVVFVERLDDATAAAAWYARQIAGRDYRAICVRDPKGPDPRGRWWDFSGGGVPIEALDRVESVADTVIDYTWALPRGESAFVTVVVPELFDRPSLVSAILRRRATFAIKLKLLREPGIVITDVPVVADATDARQPERLLGRVLVSGAGAASLRAVNYLRTLGLEDARAVFFAFDESDAKRMRLEWERQDCDLPLDVVQAPFRDLGDPLLRYLRGLTADPATAVSVVMPELFFTGWRRLLHNQRAFYIKRLLLFEPRVLLSSVPYQLP